MAGTKNAVSSRGKPYSCVSGSLHADDARRVSDFRLRLYSDDWEELGEFATVVPNWSTGDEFTTGDGRRFRIVGIVPVDDDVGIYNALWKVCPSPTDGRCLSASA